MQPKGVIETVLFITEQGSRIVKQGRAIHIYKDGQKIFMYPIENISQVVIMGRVEVTTAMLGFLMRMGIDTVFLSRDGRFKGKVIGESSKNILVREKQFFRRRQAQFCLNFSRNIVLAKIVNSRNLLRRRAPNIYQALKPRIKTAVRSVQGAASLQILRGLEGSFGAFYFKHFPAVLHDAFGFKKRIKHPPPDPLNILLSLAYTLLFNSIYSLVQAAGLDPFAGFFHQSSYGHPALVSDLMEPFRAPVADQLVMRLINNRKITRESFLKEKGKIILSQEALQTFVNAYRQRLFRRYSLDNRQETLWSVLQKEVWKFMKTLEDSHQQYTPHIFR